MEISPSADAPREEEAPKVGGVKKRKKRSRVAKKLKSLASCVLDHETPSLNKKINLKANENMRYTNQNVTHDSEFISDLK